MINIKTILDSKGDDVVTAEADASVVEVAAMFKKNGIGFTVIVEGGKILGTVSERDIVHALIKNDGNVAGLKARDIATANIITCSSDALTDHLSDLMTNKRTRHVIVMDAGDLMGVISIGDLVKHNLNECKVDSSAMREYITGQGYQ